MTRKDSKLAKKLTNFRKSNPPMTKKKERKTKRAVRRLRQGMREQQEIALRPHLEALEEDLERQRIIREVEKEDA